MSVRTYKTTKSPNQVFVHIHFVIGEDHHIVEINDAMSKNRRLSDKDIKDAISSEVDYKYIFQADDEGFYQVSNLNPDTVVSGNVTNYDNDSESRFIFMIKAMGGTRYVILKSTFNNKQVTTVEALVSPEQNKIIAKMVSSIVSILYSGLDDWLNECYRSYEY